MPLPLILAALLSERVSTPALADDEGPSTDASGDATDKAPFLPAPDPYVLLQVWATAYDMDEDPTADPAGYGDPEDDIGFKIRRARAGFTGHGDDFAYALIVGVSAPFDALTPLSGEEIELVDAYAGYAPVEDLWFTAGVQKVPVSRESLMSAAQLVLAERSVGSEWLIPADREAGLTAEYQAGSETTYGKLTLGAFNGSGTFTGDDNSGKLLAGRAEFVLGEENPYRTFGVSEGLTLAIAGDGWMDADLATTTIGYGGDVIVRIAGLAFLAEGRMANLAPTASDVDAPGVLAETARFSALAQVGYTVGRFEPAVRYSMFDDDRSEDGAGDVADVTAGLTWHGPQDAIRLGGGYVYRMERAGAASSNDTARLWMQMKL